MNLRHAMVLAAPSLLALARAGGLYLDEVGTSDLGFAGAGTAARAEDASTVYANPAGMTRLSGNQNVHIEKPLSRAHWLPSGQT